MGTDDSCMGYIHDEISRAVGLPVELGGIPLDEIGAAGYGLAVCADVAKDYVQLELEGARLTIEGFGSVGKHTARFFSERGVKLIAVSDSKGTIYDLKGLNVEELIKIKERTGSVINYKKGEALRQQNLPTISTDIFIPCSAS